MTARYLHINLTYVGEAFIELGGVTRGRALFDA
jgi:hypothetical protein